jgi:hypothetical protein
MKNKQNEKDFIEESFLKVIKTSENCIKNGVRVSNVLVILKKDFTAEFIDVFDKGVKEIRNLLPTYDMLCYIYAIECEKINRHTGSRKRQYSIAICKSDFYKRMDIEFDFEDKKIISKKITDRRKDKDYVDVLDLWGNFETITIK